MQTNEGEVQVRSFGTPLASFWDSKHTQMWIHRVYESVHITWNKADPYIPELPPWALAFYPSLSNFPVGIRKEITPPRAWRRAMYSRGLAESTEQWMLSPVKHRTNSHLMNKIGRSYTLNVLVKNSKQHFWHHKNIPNIVIWKPPTVKNLPLWISPLHVTTSICKLTCSTACNWWAANRKDLLYVQNMSFHETDKISALPTDLIDSDIF